MAVVVHCEDHCDNIYEVIRGNPMIGSGYSHKLWACASEHSMNYNLRCMKLNIAHVVLKAFRQSSYRPH